MPELPRFYSTKGAPSRSALVPVSPTMMGVEAEEVGKSGERLAELGRVGRELSQKIEEAADAEKILNTHYKLKDDFRTVAEKFNQRRNYDKFDDDANKEMEAIRQTYEPGLTSDNLRKGFDRSFMAQSSGLKDVLLHKKVKIIEENALGAFGRTYNEAVNDYISTNDEDVKRAIEINLEVEAEVLVSRNIMKPADRDKLLSTFSAQAEEAQIRNIGIIDPLKAYGLLMDKTTFPSIDLIKRAQLTEHMEVRARLEESRQDKLTTAIQRENQANAINDFAVGKLDIERLLIYRRKDLEADAPGLSDAFFLSMLEKLKQGKDVVTDQKIFNDLYLDENITREKIDAKSGSLNVGDQRVLINRILQERREDERDSKTLRRERIAEERREVSEEKREKSAQERAGKERRNHYTSDARAYMKKAFNELDIEAEEGGKMLRTFQGYVDDPKIPPEELVEYAQKVLEGRKGGAARQLWNWMFPDKAKTEMQERISAPPPQIPPKPSPAPSVAGPRKPLGEIFGGRPPAMREKGPGFFGTLETPRKGEYSTELSIGVNIDGREIEIPSLVPTLTKKEIDHMLAGNKPTEEITNKAVAHAKKRIKEGKSPFAQVGEQITTSSAKIRDRMNQLIKEFPDISDEDVYKILEKEFKKEELEGFK